MSDRAKEFHALYGELRIADQKRFYQDRRDEYRSAHHQAIVVRNSLLIAAAVASAAGQATQGTVRSAIAVAAAVCAALAGVVTAFSALVGFSWLDKLYADARQQPGRGGDRLGRAGPARRRRGGAGEGRADLPQGDRPVGPARRPGGVGPGHTGAPHTSVNIRPRQPATICRVSATKHDG